MTVKEAPYYWVVCDDCGKSAQDGDFTAYAAADQSLNEAKESDWFIGDPAGPHYCEPCSVKRIVCTDCFEEIAESTDAARAAGWELDPQTDEWVGPKCALAEVAGQEALEVQP